MKAITYNGLYCPIVRNNGVSVNIIIPKGPAKGSTQVVNYSEFSSRQQKMLERNKTHTDYVEKSSFWDPTKKIKVAVDCPRSCDPSSELYWSM